MRVAYAIVREILKRDEVPGEIHKSLEKPIAFYRQGLADGSISMDQED